MAVFTVGLNVFGFLAVALLSGYLAESAAPRRRTAGRDLESARRPAGVQPAHHRQLDERTGDDGHGRQGAHVQSRGGGHHRDQGWRGGSAARSSDVLQMPDDLADEMFGPREGRPRLPRVEIAFTRDSGYGTIELGLSTALLYTPRGETGFLFTFQDVTESRKVEREARAQQRLAAVGEMAAGIAHEIRNPLASMSGSIQILRQELPLTDEQSQLMDIVLRESDRLNETIRSFLVVRAAAAVEREPDGCAADRRPTRPRSCRTTPSSSMGIRSRWMCPQDPVWYVAEPQSDPSGRLESRDERPARDAQRRRRSGFPWRAARRATARLAK